MIQTPYFNISDAFFFLHHNAFFVLMSLKTNSSRFEKDNRNMISSHSRNFHISEKRSDEKEQKRAKQGKVEENVRYLTLSHVHEWSFLLHPARLASRSFSSVLRWYADQFSSQSQSLQKRKMSVSSAFFLLLFFCFAAHLLFYSLLPSRLLLPCIFLSSSFHTN